MNKNEMGGACSTYGSEVHSCLWWGNLRERGDLEDVGIDVRIILKWIFKISDGGLGLD
jgi:hypothetical protein